MGRRRNKGRPVNGIVLLDKPQGITSNRALQIIKRLYKAAKAGHTGSLDPLATGLLPLCLGEATKVSGFLLDADKRYNATLKLGVRTTSADAEGEVVEQREIGVYTREQIEQVLDSFTGEIEQIPPMHSALKVNGQPLYKLAHQGKEIERKPRQVHIYQIELLRHDGDELDIAVHCSKGTYIRTLAEDIGEQLGCGAHLSALRRTASGPFALENAVSLSQLEQLATGDEDFSRLDAVLVPAEDALRDWPSVSLSDNTAFYLLRGQAVLVPRAPTEGKVRVFAESGTFLGIGEVMDDGKVKPVRLFVQGNGAA